MKRLYQNVIKEHFAHYQQILIINGPRQAGKTTLCRELSGRAHPQKYLNWDIQEDSEQILQGQRTLAKDLGVDELNKKTMVVFDELHKFSKWKNFLKGFYDAYKDNCDIIVTGSQKLNVQRKSGDSLMGRYFPLRVHPLSVAECLYKKIPENIIRPPKRLAIKEFDALWNFGGFPDPFMTRNKRFLTRWQHLRNEQLFQGDIKDLTQIQELRQLEVLAKFLNHQACDLVNYTSLAKKVAVDTKTVQKWITTLEQFYYCFRLQPWSTNLPRSLLKEPKIFLWDWSAIEDKGARAENFVACHLLKAVNFWTDIGLGDFGLYFLRTKDKREVDFVVTRDNQPWFMVEVKYSSNAALSDNLYYFQERLSIQHAFQVCFDMEYVNVDCFSKKGPIKVPVSTFLSQLV